MRTKAGCRTSGSADIQEASGWYCMIRGGLIVVAGISDLFIFLQAKQQALQNVVTHNKKRGIALRMHDCIDSHQFKL